MANFKSRCFVCCLYVKETSLWRLKSKELQRQMHENQGFHSGHQGIYEPGGQT